MPPGTEPPMAFPRLLELAASADRQGRCRFTPFLTPPEAELALAAAKRIGVAVALHGGYPDAERRMARFCPPLVEEEPFPIATVEVSWPHADAPEHRDLLGAMMGLGVKRARTGDIVLTGEHAYLFVEVPLAGVVLEGLLEAGRTRVQTRLVDRLPETSAPVGEEVRFTVPSARLDAVVADGFHLSRGVAAELIQSGAVKLRHAQTLRPDARVAPGDAVSVLGHGRLMVAAIGEPTRKGRLPVTAMRFGALR